MWVVILPSLQSFGQTWVVVRGNINIQRLIYGKNIPDSDHLPRKCPLTSARATGAINWQSKMYVKSNAFSFTLFLQMDELVHKGSSQTDWNQISRKKIFYSPMQGLPISPADTISPTLETSLIWKLQNIIKQKQGQGTFYISFSPLPFFLMRPCNSQFLRKIFQSVREFPAGIQEVVNFYLVDCNLSVFRCQYCTPVWQCNGNVWQSEWQSVARSVWNLVTAFCYYSASWPLHKTMTL